MKILYYNWVDYLDDEKRGGGVTVYQRNLMRAFAAAPDVDAWFLSSGISYDLLASRPRWERMRHGPKENRRRRFEIVNSGTMSPSHHSFGAPEQVDHPGTVAVLFDFVERNGPFDVIHFNNLEGIPASVLALKERWPETRLILSLHNYYPVCPQVNLWYQERENCTDFDGGRKCEHCLPFQHEARVVRLANSVAFRLKKFGIRPGTRLFDRAFLPGLRLGGRLERTFGRFARAIRRVPLLRAAAAPVALAALPRRGQAGPLRPLRPGHVEFAQRRRDFVDLINAHCDLVLCVSDRVGALAERHGIRPEILRTSYIGTNQAEKFRTTRPRETILRPDGTLSLGYLGYMRRDKGFYFLLEALEQLPEAIAGRLHLVVAARNTDQGAVDRLTAMGDRFASVSFADGYTHDTLDDILAEIDVGVIPVLWEDNLPQVAIEMHARHIPLLTADMGGARELGACPDMVFRAGDRMDLMRRIRAILNGEVTSAGYWAGQVMTPVSMEGHLEDLRHLYRGGPMLISGPEAEAEAPDAAAHSAPETSPQPVRAAVPEPGQQRPAELPQKPPGPRRGAGAGSATAMDEAGTASPGPAPAGSDRTGPDRTGSGRTGTA